MKKNILDIESLLKAQEITSDAAVKAALEEAAKLEREKQQKIILDNYQKLFATQEGYIHELRRIRNEERRLSRMIHALEEAKVKFVSGAAIGDKWNELKASLVKENIHL